MGHFLAKLFRGLGNNEQLKINWSTIFLKIIAITQTYVYRREIGHYRLRASSVVFGTVSQIYSSTLKQNTVKLPIVGTSE
jgi:hypothetical protein